MSLEQLWSQMSGQSIYAYPATWQTPIIDGQSLALGYNGTVEERATFNYINRRGIKLLAGLLRSDNAVVNLGGPLSLGYNTSVPATEHAPAEVKGNAPGCFLFALGLDAWRAVLGRPRFQQVVGFNAIAGVSILELDDDDPIVTGGVWGTVIRDSHAYWLSEAYRLYNVQPLIYGVVQGEANVSWTRAEYRIAATESYNDALDDIVAITGVRPPLVLWQTGGYTDTIGDAYGSTLAQLDLLADFNGTLATPIYPFLTHDNVVHPGHEASILMYETGAYVWAKREAGITLSMTYGTPSVVGNQITIPVNGIESGKSLTFDPVDKYGAYGGIVDRGVQVSGTTVTSVALSGNNIVVTAGAALSGRTVSIAMQSANMTAFADGLGRNYVAHRCDIMESNPVGSLILPGNTLKRFVASEQWVV